MRRQKEHFKTLEAVKFAAIGSHASLPAPSPTAAILIAIQYSNRMLAVHLVVGAFLISRSILKAFECSSGGRNDFALQEQ